MRILWLVPVGAAISFLLTWFVHDYAIRKRIIDVPNERSSHDVPTPRGGGLAIVITLLVLSSLLWTSGTISLALFIALLAGGGAIAAIGWFDDQSGISPLKRILVHFAAAICSLWLVGGLPAFQFLSLHIEGGYVLNALAVLYLVWATNLYNFMDGIDGIASVETLTTCLGAIAIWFTTDSPLEIAGVSAALLGATLGFLWWNLPPAKIFMGDVGSGFLGLVLAILSIRAAGEAPGVFFAWLILMAAFVVDSTVTLVRRAYRRERVFSAHRSHAYQNAAVKLGSHGAVTFGVCLINLLWLCPLAVLTANDLVPEALGVALAYIPLVVLALALGAGAGESGPK